jgi:hypothetical protein
MRVLAMLGRMAEAERKRSFYPGWGRDFAGQRSIVMYVSEPPCPDCRRALEFAEVPWAREPE